MWSIRSQALVSVVLVTGIVTLLQTEYLDSFKPQSIQAAVTARQLSSARFARAVRPLRFIPTRSVHSVAKAKMGAQSEIAGPGNYAPPKTSLLLIDLQKAFTTGAWARHFGGEAQVQDIDRSCNEVAKLFSEGRIRPGTPVICTKCYLGGKGDEPYVDVLEKWLRDYPCIHKPTMDVTLNKHFEPWLMQQVKEGLELLVVGGCTTTSCVRVSSQATVRLLEAAGLSEKVRVVVDLNLCGARSDNFEKTAELDPVLVKLYGREFCLGKSAVDLAVVQMRRAGVEVVEEGGVLGVAPFAENRT